MDRIAVLTSGGDSPGMNAVQLRLLNFDGRRPTREVRLTRLLVSIVSFCSLGVGLAWWHGQTETPRA